MIPSSFSIPWIHHENTSCWYILAFGSKPSLIFHHSLGIFTFYIHILLSQNWWQDQSQYLSYQKKCIIPSSRNISVNKKCRVSAENTGIKVSALPPSWPFLLLWYYQFYNKLIKYVPILHIAKEGVPSHNLSYSHFNTIPLFVKKAFYQPFHWCPENICGQPCISRSIF